MGKMEDLANIVGKERVKTDKDLLESFQSSLNFISGEVPECVVEPQNLEDVQNLVKLANRKELHVTFDKPIDASSINKYDFRLFSQYSTTISDISVDRYNKKLLRRKLSANILTGDYLSFSYFPGSLASTDGGKAMPVGLYPISSYIPVNLDLIGHEADITIYPVPVSDILNIEGTTLSSVISIFNSTGILVYSGHSNSQGIVQIRVEHLEKGIYFVKITDQNDYSIVKKIIIK
jgi:hypothetical protein